MADERITAIGGPPSVTVLVSPEDFAPTLAALAAAEDRAGGEPIPVRRAVAAEDIEALVPRGMRIVAGSGVELELDGRTVYLVEGESSLHPFDLSPPSPREFEGKLTTREPRPDQQAGFYRRFENRRPDGSMARGRRR